MKSSKMMSLSTIKAARRQVGLIKQDAISCGANGDNLALQVALDCMDQCIAALEAERSDARRNEWLSDAMERARARVLGPASCVQGIYIIGNQK